MVLREDPDDPAKKTAMLNAAFAESMGTTNMVIRTWNAGGQITEVRIFGALAVMPLAPEPAVVDPELAVPLAIVDPDPPADPNSADRVLLAVRMWSGFESESISDAQLLASLGLDYPGIDIPNWVMTELEPLVVKGSVEIDEFKVALQYVLENT